MKQIAATFFDGKTPHKKDVRLCFEGTGHVLNVGLGTELVYPLLAVRINSRVANTPRSPVSFGPLRPSRTPP